MFRSLADWFDHRTGYRRVISALLIEEIPGGARWRYVWGSCLAFTFMIQLITGLLLVTGYSPGDSTAWASVYYIQYQVDFGWLIRGLHHFGSQAMIVLICLHMLQVVIAGAHLPPREVNWWLGLILLGLVLAMSLTGYLLPWDQKGYWATQVATNIVGGLPRVGPWLQKIVIGGPTYGHQTLTRFYTLHVVVLPLMIITLIGLHVALFRRHGVTTPKGATGEGWFWPDQAFKDMVVCLGLLALLIGLVMWGHAHPIEPLASTPPPTSQPSEPDSDWMHQLAHAGRRGAGANLDAPADPSQPYPARPEWYFLFLFQLLKKYEGDQVLIGTVYIPGGVAAALFILPLLGYGRMRSFGRAVGIMTVTGLLVAVIVLTGQAMFADARNAELRKEFKQAGKVAARAVQLADLGIPPAGAGQLLRRDPLTRGAELFGRNCASCHNYGDLYTGADKASDLYGFGSKDWILGLLKNPRDPKYFGHTELKRMAEWVDEELTHLSAERQAELNRVAEWLASHPTSASPQAETETYKQALASFVDTFNCIKCHKYEGDGGTSRAPDFTGYGGADWIRGMILSPDHRSRYGKDNAMTIFLDLDGPDAAILRQDAEERKPGIAHLATVDRELIIRWMTGDPRPVYGGEPVSTPAMPVHP